MKNWQLNSYLEVLALLRLICADMVNPKVSAAISIVLIATCWILMLPLPGQLLAGRISPSLH
jgi:hypothetical protein